MPLLATNVLSRTNFSALDWAIVAVYLAISVAIGPVVFAGMAVWVTIGGARDIKRLFRTLDEQHRKGEA